MRLLSKEELRAINSSFEYNARDKKLVQLSEHELSDYDAYLIVCALCNYDIELHDDLIYTRSYLFAHVDTSKPVKLVSCKNLHRMNKYGHYEYEVNDPTLDRAFWLNKDKLKYVAVEENRLVISVARSQIHDFITILDNLDVDYDVNDILDGLIFNNNSFNKLIDYTKYNLPFKPYDFQIEDAKELVTKKRALLGSEMGCITGDGIIEVKKHFVKKMSLAELFNDFKDYKIKTYVAGNFQFLPIKEVLYKGKKQVLEIKTQTSSIKCTYDHELLTPKGWVEAQNLHVGDKLINHTIIAVTPLGHEDVYDVAIDDFFTSNFVVNNIVVHNCGKTFISVLVGESIYYDSLENVEQVMTDQGILGIQDIIANHIDCKVQVTKNGKTAFVDFRPKKLVICPESLRLNWQKEILQVDPSLDVQILYAGENYHTGQDWTIVGYLTANNFLNELKEFKCIFVDEVHNCKAVNNWGNPTSKRASTVIDLTLNADYCYLLSGTPVPSHNRDLFNILKMLKCPEFDFNSNWAFKDFGTRFCDPKMTRFGMDYSGNSNSQDLHKLLDSLMIRRLKKDVLPDLKKQRQFIPIRPKLSRAYKDIEKRLYYPTIDDTYMGLAMTGRKLLSELKVDTAIELAENIVNAEESVVIVTNFVKTADLLKAHFKGKACEIRGGMNDAARDQAIRAFQAKKKPVCILNMVAGGVGITLTAASKMIMIDYSWIPAESIQTEDRICRAGQENMCNIYYIYATNSILDKIFVDMISEKAENISYVVDDTQTDYNLAKIKEDSSTYLERLKREIQQCQE